MGIVSGLGVYLLTQTTNALEPISVYWSACQITLTPLVYDHHDVGIMRNLSSMDSLTQTMNSDHAMGHKILINALLADVVKPSGNIIKIFKPHWYQLVL